VGLEGEGEQDGEDLAVSTATIYIQEKISPQAIIENLRLEQKREKPDEQIIFSFRSNGNKATSFGSRQCLWSKTVDTAP